MNYFILSILICFLFVDFNSALDRKKDCKCRLLSDKKIIGGKYAKKLDYRWQVSVSLIDKRNLSDSDRKSQPEQFKLGLHMCGGIILNERWILTAGHCLSFNPSVIRVGLGTNDLVDMYDNNKYVDVEATYRHPKFGSRNEITHNDIGLIKTASKINFTDLIQPACVNFDKTDLYNGPLKLTGWGSINKVAYSNDPRKNMMIKISRYLKEAVNYDITDKSDLCKHDNSWESICIGNEKTKEAACKGDSGGPLHLTDNSGKTSVIGLTSFTNVDRANGTVTVCTGKQTAYTRVSGFQDFVEQYIGEDYC